MKFYPRLRLFKNTSATLMFYPNELTAWSYAFQFLKVIDGTPVLCLQRISVTTSRHQRTVQRYLDENGIQYRTVKSWGEL